MHFNEFDLKYGNQIQISNVEKPYLIDDSKIVIYKKSINNGERVDRYFGFYVENARIISTSGEYFRNIPSSINNFTTLCPYQDYHIETIDKTKPSFIYYLDITRRFINSSGIAFNIQQFIDIDDYVDVYIYPLCETYDTELAYKLIKN